MIRTRADEIADAAWARGDRRERCSVAAHLVCRGCGECSCVSGAALDPMEYPNGVFRVVTDKQGRTLCRECRYQEDVLNNDRSGVRQR